MTSLYSFRFNDDNRSTSEKNFRHYVRTLIKTGWIATEPKSKVSPKPSNSLIRRVSTKLRRQDTTPISPLEQTTHYLSLVNPQAPALRHRTGDVSTARTRAYQWPPAIRTPVLYSSNDLASPQSRWAQYVSHVESQSDNGLEQAPVAEPPNSMVYDAVSPYSELPSRTPLVELEATTVSSHRNALMLDDDETDDLQSLWSSHPDRLSELKDFEANFGWSHETTTENKHVSVEDVETIQNNSDYASWLDPIVEQTEPSMISASMIPRNWSPAEFLWSPRDEICMVCHNWHLLPLRSKGRGIVEEEARLLNMCAACSLSSLVVEVGTNAFGHVSEQLWHPYDKTSQSSTRSSPPLEPSRLRKAYTLEKSLNGTDAETPLARALCVARNVKKSCHGKLKRGTQSLKSRVRRARSLRIGQSRTERVYSIPYSCH